jgi:hypothetical protein
LFFFIGVETGFFLTVIGILCDWQYFYEHDNKENQLAASASEDHET